MPADFSVELGGLKLRNPVMTASGCFGFGEEYSKLIDVNALGAIVCKTVTLEPRLGNAPHRTWETSAGMLNSIGLENPGIDGFIKDKIPNLWQYEPAIIASIAGFTFEEFAKLAQRLEKAKGPISAIEVNISCPNVEQARMPFGATPEPAAKVTRLVKENTTLPVIVKLTPNVSAPFIEIVQAVEQAGADCLSMINTLLGMAIDVKKRTPRISTTTAGLSGPAIKPHALYRVWQAHKATKLPIIGIGGIASWEDAVEFILAGASAVGIGTACFIDPDVFTKVIKGIEKYLEEGGYKSISEIIGQMKEPA